MSEAADAHGISRRALLQACAAAMVTGPSRFAAAALPPLQPSNAANHWSLNGVKFILLARRKPGLSLEEFKDYYENHHSKLIHLLQGAPLTRYFRRYLHPQAHLDPGATGEAHDVISELWCNSLGEMHAVMERFADPAVGGIFDKDEANLFDRSSMKTYRVEEHETDLTHLSKAAAAWRKEPTDDVVKSILVAHRRAGMSMEEFKAYYENHHSKVVNDLSNPPLVRYFRRFLYPQAHLDPKPGGEPPSVVMEMWYRTRADMDRVDRSFYESSKVDFYIQDEGRLFDRPSMKYYVAEEHESDLRAIGVGPHG